jgi:hypothetical protein
VKQKVIIVSFFIFILRGPALYPQTDEASGVGEPVETTIIALVPFKGSPEDIIIEFGDVLQEALPNVGAYTPFPVDMNNLPPDVPPGGYPA